MKRACQARNTLPVPTPLFNKSRLPGEGGACLEITMSTFAVFGMTRDVALAEAKKRVKTSKPGKHGAPQQLSPAQWDEAVAKYADKLMSSEKVRQLSNLFDAPQYAQQFIELARKQSECRDMRIRARCAMMDAKGSPVINPKTKMPNIGWTEYASN